MRKRSALLISLLFFVLLVETVYAPDNEIDLTTFDDALGDALGIGAFGGGLLASVFILFLILGCLGGAMRRAPSPIMTVAVVIGTLSFCIACGWFPVWSLVGLVLLIALLFGRKTMLRGGDD